MLTIQLDNMTFTVGGRVSGSALWTPNTTVTPRQIRVSAIWKTEGRGDKSTGTADELRLEPGPQGFTPPVTIPFALYLPADGPISYDGKILRIMWQIVARIDLPWAKDEIAEQPFRVVPLIR